MQATEIAVALIFVDISVHVAHGGLLVVAALAFVALAVTAQGPLGHRPGVRAAAPRAAGRRSLAVLLALAPIIPALRPDIQGIIVIEFGAVGLHPGGHPDPHRRRPGPVRPESRGRVRVIDTTATVVGDAAPPGPGTTVRARAPRPGRAPHPAQPPARHQTSDSAARWAGRASGTVVTTGKRVAAKYRPEAEEQVKAHHPGGGQVGRQGVRPSWRRPRMPTDPGLDSPYARRPRAPERHGLQVAQELDERGRHRDRIR